MTTSHVPGEEPDAFFVVPGEPWRAPCRICCVRGDALVPIETLPHVWHPSHAYSIDDEWAVWTPRASVADGVRRGTAAEPWRFFFSRGSPHPYRTVSVAAVARGRVYVGGYGDEDHRPVLVSFAAGPPQDITEHAFLEIGEHASTQPPYGMSHLIVDGDRLLVVGIEMISLMPPSVCTPITLSDAQQLVLPRRQAMQAPQLRYGSTAQRSPGINPDASPSPTARTSTPSSCPRIRG